MLDFVLLAVDWPETVTERLGLGSVTLMPTEAWVTLELIDMMDEVLEAAVPLLITMGLEEFTLTTGKLGGGMATLTLELLMPEDWLEVELFIILEFIDILAEELEEAVPLLFMLVLEELTLTTGKLGGGMATCTLELLIPEA